MTLTPVFTLLVLLSKAFLSFLPSYQLPSIWFLLLLLSDNLGFGKYRKVSNWIESWVYFIVISFSLWFFIPPRLLKTLGHSLLFGLSFLFCELTDMKKRWKSGRKILACFIVFPLSMILAPQILPAFVFVSQLLLLFPVGELI